MLGDKIIQPEWLDVDTILAIDLFLLNVQKTLEFFLHDDNSNSSVVFWYFQSQFVVLRNRCAPTAELFSSLFITPVFLGVDLKYAILMLYAVLKNTLLSYLFTILWYFRSFLRKGLQLMSAILIDVEYRYCFVIVFRS